MRPPMWRHKGYILLLSPEADYDLPLVEEDVLLRGVGDPLRLDEEDLLLEEEDPLPLEQEENISLLLEEGAAHPLLEDEDILLSEAI